MIRLHPPPPADVGDDVGAGAILSVLTSKAVTLVRRLLRDCGLDIVSAPIVCKKMPGDLLRLMFPTTCELIERGTVASVVCLHNLKTATTLYAHPMHAGPEVNPLLLHPHGPMASPKAQPGTDGDRATTRMVAQKRALWGRFLEDKEIIGPAAASAGWRKSYFWSLKRLYFCTRCTSCRWGSPFFDGPDPHAPPKISTRPVSHLPANLTKSHADAVAEIVSSDVWMVEEAYAQRGGFCVSRRPKLVKELGDGLMQFIFPTDAALIEGGSLVGVSTVYSTRDRHTVFAHCLCAGPEPEIQFMLGNEALGLPLPCDDVSQTRPKYASWRRDAWSRFWLDELDSGIATASERWLTGFWSALEDLFDRSSASRLASTNGAVPVIDRQSDFPAAIPLETLQNTGDTCFAGHASQGESPELRATGLSTIMVNLGRRCNQSCTHCHVDAGPHRTEQMTRETVDQVIDVLRRNSIDTLDITGGAPEMNPHFRYLASTASELCTRVIDRCNLTILVEPGYEDLAEFLAKHEIEITASLPHYEASDVDRQRGNGTFEKSIAALRMLNALGYGQEGSSHILNLVYNPMGTDLAPPEEQLQDRFKHELGTRFDVGFNRLFAMNNLPVNRFRDHLARSGQLASYSDRLVGAFNPATVGGLMCRRTLSVGYDGRLFDCDFNQALDLPLNDGLPMHIRDFDASALRARAINTAAHCFGCAAGAGSSCSGALTAATRPAKTRRQLVEVGNLCASGSGHA